jgi:hypothetical protein
MRSEEEAILDEAFLKYCWLTREDVCCCDEKWGKLDEVAEVVGSLKREEEREEKRRGDFVLLCEEKRIRRERETDMAALAE